MIYVAWFNIVLIWRLNVAALNHNTLCNFSKLWYQTTIFMQQIWKSWTHFSFSASSLQNYCCQICIGECIHVKYELVLILWETRPYWATYPWTNSFPSNTLLALQLHHKLMWVETHLLPWLYLWTNSCPGTTLLALKWH